MDRRTFFKGLVGIFVALPLASKIPEVKEKKLYCYMSEETGECGFGFSPPHRNHVLTSEELSLHVKNSTELAFLDISGKRLDRREINLGEKVYVL
jgi:hypothetical protein